MNFLFGLLVAGVLPKANGFARSSEQQTRRQDESPSFLPLRDSKMNSVHTEAAGTVFPLTVSGGCTADLILEAVAEECDCLAAPFLKALAGLVNEEDDDDEDSLLHERLGQLCATAWGTVERSTWQDVDPMFEDQFMERFVQGETYLNVETGNLSTDPVEAYPTSLASFATAGNVKDFYEGPGFQKTILQSFASTSVMTTAHSSLVQVGDGENHNICPNTHSVMCCWGRDRQSNDGNGNCDKDDCDDADPADNSNLCKTEDEGDIHCHGLAWSNDPNHISAMFKFNTFFYVSLYDHWYTRGYVENSLGSSFNKTGIPMCGCVDEMPMVTRADCSQVTSVDITFTVQWSEEDGLSIDAGPLTSIQVATCQGHEFGNPKRSKDNDLASHINSMVANEKMPIQAQAQNFETLVGYGQPNNNDNDEACALGMARQVQQEGQLVQTSQGRAKQVKGGPSASRGPMLQIVASAVLCLSVVVGVVLLGVKSAKQTSVQEAGADEDAQAADCETEDLASF